MLGAIFGDIVGSVHEHTGTKTADFPLFTPLSRFTDDSVLTVAVAHSILAGVDYKQSLWRFGNLFPQAGYGKTFRSWLRLPVDEAEPCQSFGNGSAMRVAAIGWAFDTVASVLMEAEKSAAVTHNHPEGIKGAQSVALAIFRARTGASKADIKTEIETRFGYNLSRRIEDIRPGYRFDVTCQGSVPESIIAFLESESVEDAIRKAVSFGGDADTMAAIAGSMAEAHYKHIPSAFISEVKARLPERLLEVADRFCARYLER